MLFNSFQFLIFLPVTLTLYFLCPARMQNLLLLAASLLFYGYWNPTLLAFLAVTALLDFLVGRLLETTQGPRARKLLLLLSLSANLGMLGFFKYRDFFVQSLIDLGQRWGFDPDLQVLGLVVPVGISFYTFQTMSYVIDVYRRKIPPATDVVTYMAYVSFFPQLVAGPIERAGDLLPQFQQTRRLDLSDMQRGGLLILWGFLKKTVVADNLASVVATGYEPGAPGSWALLSTYAFAFQIYCDFSGYSDIARGTASLFGFRLVRNFDAPYLAISLEDFWRRWHISLSSWFREYVYVPLGGSRCSRPRHLTNVVLTFVLSGFWHGAAFRFIAWGLAHGLGYLPSVLMRSRAGDRSPGIARRILGWLFTFHFVVLAWVFFRASDLTQATEMLSSMGQLLLGRETWAPPTELLARVLVLGGGMLATELIARRLPHLSESPRARTAAGLVMVTIILLLGKFDDVPFIYFQF
jgi:D-alanyl-lipoteichoic acid acyltransferase DltB (MBOAT superfamily)